MAGHRRRRCRPVVGLLTRREREVLRLVAQGLSNQEICDALWLTMPTVKSHIGNLIAKTHSRDRVQLVLFALRTGIADLN
ncbi:MAG: LuxR C-terminal-related transcriptional regulator [Micropruina sp.]|uniref:response regulator transcription factor n=1 Tax=Micropruina sp. TaxID=2737536 RepID=UPI0039E4C939